MATSAADDTADAAADAKRVTLRCQFCLTWNRVDPARAADRPKCGSCQKPMLLDRPVPLDDETFARTVQESGVPVLVDFYAEWCGPCKVMAPFVDQLAAKYLGRVLVAKLDTDRAQRTATEFRITGVPTVGVFKDGKAVAMQAGAGPLPYLENLLRQAGVS